MDSTDLRSRQSLEELLPQNHFSELDSEPPADSKFMRLLRISGFFRFIKQTFGILSESFGKMGQIDQI